VTSVCKTFHRTEYIPLMESDGTVSVTLQCSKFNIVNINRFMVIIGDLQGRGINLVLRDV